MTTVRKEFGYTIQQGGTEQSPVFHIVDSTDTCIMRKPTLKQANNFFDKTLIACGLVK